MAYIVGIITQEKNSYKDLISPEVETLNLVTFILFDLSGSSFFYLSGHSRTFSISNICQANLTYFFKKTGIDLSINNIFTKYKEK